jgi:hypothetical protein
LFKLQGSTSCIPERWEYSSGQKSVPHTQCGPSRGIGLFLQARADLKHEYYRPWVVLSIVHTFFIDCPFKGNSMLSKNIRTILRCGSQSLGGFDPAGGATSESPIPWEGPHRKVQSPGRGHIGKSDAAGGATMESPISREGPQQKVRSLSLPMSLSLSLSSPKRVDPAGGATP